MHPIFIIEGPDAVGKTTLCREFQTRANARYIHMVLRREMFLYQRAALRLALRWSKTRPVVIDRHWPSENIYAGVYRGGTNLGREMAWLDVLCEEMGVAYVYCHLRSVTDEVEAHAKTSETGRELYAPDVRIAQVALAYRDWWYGGLMADEFAHCQRVATAGGMTARGPGHLDFCWQDPPWDGRNARLFVDYAVAIGAYRRSIASGDDLQSYIDLKKGI